MADPMTPEQRAELLSRAEALTKAIDAEFVKDHDAPYAHGIEYYLGAAVQVTRKVPALLDEVERLSAEARQLRDAITYLQGPEECLERECDEYFDEDGDERPGVEYCSHLKARLLSVDEHLAVLAERDRLADEKAKLSATIAAFPDANNAANIAHARMQRDHLNEQVKCIREENLALAKEHDLLTKRVWLAAAEMHEFNSPEGDHLDGCPGCRIDAALNGTEATP